MFRKGRALKNQQKIEKETHKKIMQTCSGKNSVPKLFKKLIWGSLGLHFGGVLEVLGFLLGALGDSLGALGVLLRVLGAKMSSKRPFGWIVGRFGKVWGWFGKVWGPI